jgi:hypothetical protein
VVGRFFHQNGFLIESSTVIFRLCPLNSCTNNNTLGCDAGYADYAVGINTFAEAFAESVRDNYQYYAVNQMKDYIKECRQLEGGGNNNYNGGYTYIGPACSADGTNIRLATFSDQVSDSQKLPNRHLARSTFLEQCPQ